MLYARIVRIAVTAAIVMAVSTSTLAAQVVDQFRIAAVRLSYVARTSKIGKSELARIEDVARKKAAEVDSKAAELQRQQVELQKKSAAMSPRAVADLQRAFDRSRVDFERFQQDAQNEIEAMQTQFDVQFRAKLAPVIDEISKEKGLHFIFGLEQTSMVAWWSPSVDISDEVVKRLDAAK
jgi:Skp family chaperone for outer membrane proteins